MVKITPDLISKIIHKHLYGSSLSEVSNETGISKTTAHNIVQDWKSRLSATDIDEIRIFLTDVRRSVYHCISA